jgi:hypothetical protein
VALEEANKTWEQQCGLNFAENLASNFEIQSNNIQTNWDSLLVEKQTLMENLEHASVSVSLEVCCLCLWLYLFYLFSGCLFICIYLCLVAYLFVCSSIFVYFFLYFMIYVCLFSACLIFLLIYVFIFPSFRLSKIF